MNAWRSVSLGPLSVNWPNWFQGCADHLVVLRFVWARGNIDVLWKINSFDFIDLSVSCICVSIMKISTLNSLLREVTNRFQLKQYLFDVPYHDERTSIDEESLLVEDPWSHRWVSIAGCYRKSIELKQRTHRRRSRTVQQNRRKNRHRAARLCRAVRVAVDLVVVHHSWIRTSPDVPWLLWRTYSDASRRHQDWVCPRETHVYRHDLLNRWFRFYPKSNSPPATPISRQEIGLVRSRWRMSISQTGS